MLHTANKTDRDKHALLQCLPCSARFSQKVVSGKKPPTSKNLAAHLEILPLTPKKLVAKIATKT